VRVYMCLCMCVRMCVLEQHTHTHTNNSNSPLCNLGGQVYVVQGTKKFKHCRFIRLPVGSNLKPGEPSAAYTRLRLAEGAHLLQTQGWGWQWEPSAANTRQRVAVGAQCSKYKAESGSGSPVQQIQGREWQRLRQNKPACPFRSNPCLCAHRTAPRRMASKRLNGWLPCNVNTSTS